MKFKIFYQHDSSVTPNVSPILLKLGIYSQDKPLYGTNQKHSDILFYPQIGALLSSHWRKFSFLWMLINSETHI